MINLRFSITNPWSDRFSNVYSTAGKTPFKHKFWEFQIMRTDDILSADLRISSRTDHAGFDLWLGLLSFSVNLVVYDNRHWNTKDDCWELYGKENDTH